MFTYLYWQSFQEIFTFINRQTNTVEQMDSSLKMYREFRIIEIINSLACSKRLFPTCVTGFPAIQFSSFYVCLKLHENISWPAFGMFPMLYVDAVFLTIVIFTAASRVFKWSEDQLIEWKQNSLVITRKSRLRKTLNSLPSLKIRMGGNFVDTLTPLVIQDFCIRTSVSMLLLFQ